MIIIVLTLQKMVNLYLHFKTRTLSSFFFEGKAFCGAEIIKSVILFNNRGSFVEEGFKGIGICQFPFFERYPYQV